MAMILDFHVFMRIECLSIMMTLEIVNAYCKICF